VVSISLHSLLLLKTVVVSILLWQKEQCRWIHFSQGSGLYTKEQ
jgi:hypothetical protein